MSMDYCPLALQSNKVNIKNHKSTIAKYGLGPANPKESNDSFWAAKGNKWDCSTGDARGRLCANCEHFIETSDIKDCINNGPAKDFKTSMVDPSIIDIESKPVAWCNLYDITCSPTRTCDSQEMGGPIDDVKMKAIEMAKAMKKSGFDFEEFGTDTTEDM